jgi:RNA polymerase sigma-B factor
VRPAYSSGREAGLWRRFVASRDPRVRDELVELHMPIARQMAARYAGISEPFDDLLQVASVGLVNAVDRFDPERGIPFAGYAKPTILGELKRHFRDRTWTIRLPRSLHDLLAKVDRAGEDIAARLGRPATVEELAVELGVTPIEVLEVLEAGRNRSPMSLDAPARGDDSEVAFAELLGRPDGSLELAEDRVALRGLLPTLGPQDREILRMRFLEELPQTVIAERIGCSQMHVSRLLSRLLDRLRAEARV